MSSITKIRGQRRTANAVQKTSVNSDQKVGAEISSANTDSSVLPEPTVNVVKTVTNNKLSKKDDSKDTKEKEVIPTNTVVTSKPIQQIKNKFCIQPPEGVKKDSTIYGMYQKLGNTIDVVGHSGTACMSFVEMGLSLELIQSIQTVLKWELPSPIQSVGISPLINGNDLFCQSQTGTGKTGTYLIAILHKITENIAVRKCQSIVLAPTRELAIQIYDVACQLATFLNITIACHTGTAIPIKKDAEGDKNDRGKKDSGDNILRRRQERKLDERGVDYMHNVKPDNEELMTYSVPMYSEQLVIGTPGKLLKLVTNGNIDTSEIKLMVLDEADKILDHGFMKNIIDLFSRVPDAINIALYSATLSHEIREITTQFMVKPVYISVATENVVLDNQVQYLVKTDSPDKKEQMLVNIFGSSGVGQVMVFANRKFMADHVKNFISGLGITVEVLHSDIEADVRNANMDKFKRGEIKVLVCSDVAARGIDTIVDLVVNFDIPRDVTEFVHRSGRTGRFGKTGSVINFVSPDDEKYIKNITAFYSIKMSAVSNFFENRGTISNVI